MVDGEGKGDYMKKKFNVFLFIFLSCFFCVLVSCGYEDELPLSDVILKFKIPVSRDVSNSNIYEESEGYLDISKLDLEYKMYATNSTDLKGTQRNWTSAVKKAGDAKGVISFGLGQVVPADWRIDVQLKDSSTKKIAYTGSIQVNVGSSSNSIVEVSDNSFLKPYIPTTETGSIKIEVETNIKEKSADSSKYIGYYKDGNDFLNLLSSNVVSGLSFRYRYNNSEVLGANNGERFYLKSNVVDKYGAPIQEVKIYNSDGLDVGTISYNDEKTGYVIELKDIPFGYYFLYIDWEYNLSYYVNGEKKYESFERNYNRYEEDGKFGGSLFVYLNDSNEKVISLDAETRIKN